MRRFLRENGLSVALFALFFFTLIGQVVTGRSDYNDDREERHQSPVSLGQYLISDHFAEALFENWESEFLQMGAYVFLTIFLKQRGSADSKKLDEENDCDADPKKDKNKPGVPWPVKKGGVILKLYENSLTLTLLALFLSSFVLHAAGGAKLYSEEQIAQNKPPVGLAEYMGTSRFWFQSFQNWQSEFLSVGALVVLSIFLRQKGSPESKPVSAPNDETGD